MATCDGDMDCDMLDDDSLSPAVSNEDACKKKRQACRARINSRCDSTNRGPRLNFAGVYDVAAEMAKMLKENKTGDAATWKDPPQLPDRLCCLFSEMPDDKMCDKCAAFVRETLESTRTQCASIVSANVAAVAACLKEVERDPDAFARGDLTPSLLRAQTPLYVHPTLVGALTLSYPNVRIDVDHDTVSKIAAMIAMLHVNETNNIGPMNRFQPPESAVATALRTVNSRSALAHSLRSMITDQDVPDEHQSSEGDALVRTVTDTIMSAGKALAPAAHGDVSGYRHIVATAATKSGVVRPNDIASHFGVESRLSDAAFYVLFTQRFSPESTEMKNIGTSLIFRTRRVSDTQPQDVTFVSAQIAIMYFTDQSSLKARFCEPSDGASYMEAFTTYMSVKDVSDDVMYDVPDSTEELDDDFCKGDT